MLKKIIKLLFRELVVLIEIPLLKYPSSFIANNLRLFYFSKKLKIKSPLGSWSNIDIRANHLINIGTNLMVNKNVTIDAGGSLGIHIGNQVMIGPNVYIRSANHSYSNDLPIQEQGSNFKKIIHGDKEFSIVIEDNVWIGANCIILSGCHIGKGSVLNAGSVVSSIIPENSVVGGNPGRVVKKR